MESRIARLSQKNKVVSSVIYMKLFHDKFLHQEKEKKNILHKHRQTE